MKREPVYWTSSSKLVDTHPFMVHHHVHLFLHHLHLLGHAHRANLHFEWKISVVQPVPSTGDVAFFLVSRSRWQVTTILLVVVPLIVLVVWTLLIPLV